MDVTAAALSIRCTGYRAFEYSWSSPWNMTWTMDHMDVSTAVLYADVQEKVFVEQAPGFVVKDKDGGELVMQQEKSLNWLTLRACLKPWEPVPHRRPRPCRHRIRTAQVRHMRVRLQPRVCQDHLALYFDDLLPAGNNAEAMAIVKSQLKQRFAMTDMGDASLVLGIQIKRDRELGTLTISQEAYSKSILERLSLIHI